jgi:hypothetical protein
MKADNHIAMVGAADECSSRNRRLVLVLSDVLGTL